MACTKQRSRQASGVRRPASGVRRARHAPPLRAPPRTLASLPVSDPAQRLDAFTDAAFAFAVTLMVVGAGAGPEVDADALRATIASLPSFAIGFAIIGLFWFAHVRWRVYRGRGDARSVLLTFLLVFAVLIYVTPLRAMATSLAGFVMGRPVAGVGLAELFTIYGLGFTAMSAITVALFRDALRNPGLGASERREVRGQLLIWLILAVTGALSTLAAQVRATAILAPWLYATLPITIGLFASRWRWEEPA